MCKIAYLYRLAVFHFADWLSWTFTYRRLQIDLPKNGHSQTATAETKTEKENKSHVNI